jgi:carboxyl-terminal processing protease
MLKKLFSKIHSTPRIWLFLPVFFVFIAAGTSDILFRHAKNLDLFAAVVKEVTEYYVDPVTPTKLVRKGIEGMCKTLDPYTVLIAENDILDYRIKTTGKYGGIGVEFGLQNDSIYIMTIFEGQAANKAGLQLGDNIISINGISIPGKSEDDVQKLITGSPGTNLQIAVLRYHQKELMNFTVTREEVKVKSVPYYGMVDDSCGYIVLTTFSDECSKEVSAAFKSLKKDHPEMKSLIFDLRNNGGGFLTESINIVNLFVQKGLTIVTTKGKLAESKHTYATLNDAADPTIPIVVLTNSMSASASEIVSGSLQDLGRAVIIGQKTYGKGLVQVTKPLSYGNQLKVTIAKYYTPSGRCIQVLNYSHRNADGSVGKVPDSLKHPFKTANGRTVYDGGGIEPDITTAFEKESLLSKTLADHEIYFQYALYYHSLHPDLKPNPKTFRLNDNDFNDFQKFIQNKKYTYTTATEKQLNEFIKASAAEKYKTVLDPIITHLQDKIVTDKANDLFKFKKEILKRLNYEIIGFYCYQKGQTENTFLFDNEVQQALALFKDKKKYFSILQPTN